MLRYFILFVSLYSILFSSEGSLGVKKEYPKTIKVVTTSSWEPINMAVDGNITGIGYDFWKLIEKRIGIKSEIKIINNWSEVLKSVEDRKADLIFATSSFVANSNKTIFSKPYANFDIAIVTRNDVGFISDLLLIKDKVIAVGKDYSAVKILKKMYKNLKFLEVANAYEALEYVRDGKAYAMVDIFPVVSYMINRYKFANLKIAGEVNAPFSLRILMRSDYKNLMPLIDKAIDSITHEERKRIFQKYISVQYQKGYSKQYVMQLMLVSFLILLVAFMWIIYLKREIRKRLEFEDKLERLATIDRLTSIYNRYKMDLSLDEQIKIAKRYDRVFSIIFFDIDNFKKINDFYGHRVGDIVLSELSRVVRKEIRDCDIFGRWGGEEFLIILPETSLAEAVKTAEKLRVRIEEHHFKIVDNLTCSFGVTVVRRIDTAESIVIRADEMMYKAKQNGRNRVEFM